MSIIFKAMTVGLPPSTRGTSSPLRYENANRFYLKDGKFTEVFVYMSGENLLR